MAEVTLHDTAETPTQAVVSAATQVFTVTDERGRQIGIKKSSMLDRMRLFELIGPANSVNDMYMGYAMLAYQVVSIANEPVVRPGTKAQLEVIVQRLDDEGMQAVGKGLAQFLGAGASLAEVKEVVKNGPSTPA